MTHRRALIWVTVLLLPAALMLSCDGEEQSARKKAPPVPKVAFKVGEIRGIDAQDRPQAGTRAQEEAARVVTLLNSYYAVAFVDPSKWQGGTHPELPALFSPDVHAQLPPQVGALALGDIAPKISRLNPSKQEAPKLTVFIEADLTAPHAVVTTIFEATATAKAKAESPVKIAHTATFWLRWEGDAYKIMGFKTHLVADTETKGAALAPANWRLPA
jgi:hypothetical protein